jgi:branched-chain amino acid transport system substrate-binding protein
VTRCPERHRPELHRPELRAALVTPLSGELGGYGRAGALALELWAAWHSRQFAPPIELSVFDAGQNPQAALARAGQVDLLFGPYGSGPTAAVAAATSRLVWNHGGARVPPGPNLIPVLAPAETYFHGAVRVARQEDPDLRSVCVLAGGTGFGRAVADGAVHEAVRLGLKVAEGRLDAAGQLGLKVAEGRLDAADQFGLMVAEGRLDAAGQSTEMPPADMLLGAGRFAEEVAAARRLLPGRRWRAAGFVGAGVEEVLAELGGDREGLLGPAQWLAETAPSPDEGPSAAEFAAAYRQRAGADPPYPAAQAFAAGVIATRCLREAGTADDAALAAAACALDCTTLFGRFRLDPQTRQQVGHRVLTVQWQDGARRVIWPPEQAQARLRYPLS